MTTEEKAKQLFYSFWQAIDIPSDAYKRNAKKCAIIAVDEILMQYDRLWKPETCIFDSIGERNFTFDSEYPNCMTGLDMEDYWNEVKENIEKL